MQFQDYTPLIWGVHSNEDISLWLSRLYGHIAWQIVTIAVYPAGSCQMVTTRQTTLCHKTTRLSFLFKLRVQDTVIYFLLN